MDHLIGLLQSFVYAAVALVFMYIGKLIADKITPYDDDRCIEEDCNMAMGLRRAGLYIGIAIALAGAIMGNGGTHRFLKDIGLLVIDGCLIIPLIFIGNWVNDEYIIPAVNNDLAIKGGNVAVGVAEFGTFVATGLIINGTLSGDGRSLGINIASMIVFFLIGQATFVFLARLYQGRKDYDVVAEIKTGNVSAGVALAGMIIALGFIMRASIAGPFVGWMNDIVSFLGSTAIGVAIVLILRKAVDFLFLPNTTQTVEITRDRNTAALILTESLVIGLAIIVGSII